MLVSLASATASHGEYSLFRSTLARAAVYFFPCLAILSSVVQAWRFGLKPDATPTNLVHNSNAHRTGSTFDLLDRAVEINCVQIFHFLFRDLFHLGTCYSPDLFLVRHTGTLLHFGS